MTAFPSIRTTSCRMPPRNCAFDSYRGTVGFDIFPFAVTTRISASQQVFIKVYEDMDDSDEG